MPSLLAFVQSVPALDHAADLYDLIFGITEGQRGAGYQTAQRHSRSSERLLDRTFPFRSLKFLISGRVTKLKKPLSLPMKTKKSGCGPIGASPWPSTYATILSTAVIARSNVPLDSPVIWATELGVDCSVTSSPFTAKKPFSCATKEGQLKPPGKTLSLSLATDWTVAEGIAADAEVNVGFIGLFSLKQHSFTNGPSSGWRRLDLLGRFTKEINRVVETIDCVVMKPSVSATGAGPGLKWQGCSKSASPPRLFAFRPFGKARFATNVVCVTVLSGVCSPILYSSYRALL